MGIRGICGTTDLLAVWWLEFRSLFAESQLGDTTKKDHGWRSTSTTTTFLSVPRNATGDAINEAVKKAMRQWRKKTEAADLEIRQSAEQRIKQIEEARATLTDPGRRQAYSSKLEREGVKSAEAVPAAPAGGTWLSKAKEYVGRGDFHSAAYAAREATQIAPNDADAWSNALLGKARPKPARGRLV